MQVTLEAIKFNHDPNGGTTGAFNLRRNETETIPIPEWSVACADDPDHSAVAYAIAKLPKAVTIKAIFSCSDTSVTSIRVKAVDGHVSEQEPEFRPVNVLGEVACRPVVFQKGQSSYEVFDLVDHKISEAGTSSSINVWRWQYSLDSENWTDISITTHRVYVVPDLPTSPWEPRSNDQKNIHLPWTEVLDYACQWAAGINDEDMALVATAITKRVNDLGKVLVTYRTGDSYTNGFTFDCSAFIGLLKNGVGPQTLNCDDCATIVSTFANILGCDLSQSGMGKGFGTNRVLAIGESYWKNFTFLHHSVAWEGLCQAGNILFDACFQIDADSKPGHPPQKPIQPASIQFGTGRDRAFSFRFTRGGTCEPIPDDFVYGKKKRGLGKVVFGKSEIVDKGHLDFLKGIYNFPSSAQGQGNPHTTFSTETFAVDCKQPAFFQGWRLDSIEESQDTKDLKSFRALFRRTDSTKVSDLLTISLFECSPAKDSSAFLLQLLGRFEERLATLDSRPVGSIGFVSADEAVVVFKRDRFVVAALSAGKQKLSVVEIAMKFDRYLQSQRE